MRRSLNVFVQAAPPRLPGGVSGTLSNLAFALGKDNRPGLPNTPSAMRTALVAFGKLKTPGLRLAADHYLKGLQVWTEIEEIELKPLAVPDKSPATRRIIQEREAGMLRDLAGRRRARLVLLDEAGRQMTSRQWAGMIQEIEMGHDPGAIFAIGSSLGFSPDLRKEAHAVLGFGPQTLAHELARVVLLEQLFRAWSIIKNHPYHNEG